MQVKHIDPSTNMLLAGTVMDIPFLLDPSGNGFVPLYTILFDNGTTASIPLRDMASIIPLPPVDVANFDSHDSFLLPFLRLNSKITFEHEGQYHKGLLWQRYGVYRSVYKSHVNKRPEDWSMPLWNLPTKWKDLCVEGVLLPSHVAHLFIHSPVSPLPLAFDLVASFVSALNLHCECPPTLLKALADTHPDHEVWLQSYKKEKGGLQSLSTYRKITLGEYCALHKKGTPQAIPTMCILMLKRNKNLLPQHAKSWIVVLGNHKDRRWTKLEKFSLVLCGDSLCFLVSIAVQKRSFFCQGNCKNGFCQGILPSEEVTIVRPSSSDPDTDPQEYWLLLCTLYGLRQSPHCWYDKINAILFFYWSYSFTGRSMPLFRLHSRSLQFIWYQIECSSLPGSLRWRLCLFLRGSSSQISLLPASRSTVQSWLLRYCQLVPGHPLLVVYYSFVGNSPPQSVWLCF